jgi:hypothetical protein
MTRLAVSARPRIAALIAVLIAALPGGVALAQATLTAKAPDLVPIPSRMLQGTVSVRNAGAAAAGPSIVTVVCKKLGGGACAESPAMARFTNPAYPDAIVVAVPALTVGKVYNFKLPFWGALVWPAGKFRFTVRADAGGTIAETNEGNNKKSAVMTKP